MMNEDREKILEIVGQKWVFTYDNANGEKLMGLCNSHLSLPDMISKIRSSGGKNIIIKDQTIFFTDDKEDE